MINKSGYINKMAQFVCKCSVIKIISIKGYTDIIEILIRKFKGNLNVKFDSEDQFVELMEKIVFPDNLTDEAKETAMQTDQLLKQSALDMLKQMCIINPKHIQSVITKFYAIIKYFHAN